MASNIELYEKATIIRFLQNSLNQINRDCFEGNHGILSVTDNGDYVTVKGQGATLAYNFQKLWDALEVYSQDDCAKFYDLWDYLQSCEYIPENQETDNGLKTDNELSFSEKRQAQLVDMLLGEPVPIIDTKASALSELVEELKTKNEILEKKNRELEQSKEYNEAWIDNLKQKVHDLESSVWLLQQQTSQITVLNESVTQLNIRIYELEQENKQLKSNQTEVKPEPKPEKTLAVNKAKKSKFKLPENFAGYQQECDDLINALSCFYDIKKGKWNGNILQFILTPTDTEKTKHPCPDKWKAGLYLQPGQWTIDKVSMSDPDEWKEHFMDVYDFADSNGIEIS